MSGPKHQSLNTNKKSTTPGEEVRSLWHKYFQDIALTQPKWFERYERKLLRRAMKITADKRKKGRFKTEDELNIRRYVGGVLRRLQQEALEGRPAIVLETEVLFLTNYAITTQDRTRFTSKLVREGDCLLFDRAHTTGGYGKFFVDGRSVTAHWFAFFFELGYLPTVNGLGGVNGLQVAHTCGNRSCCDPRHLRLTTKAVNLSQRSQSTQPVRSSRAICGVEEQHYGSTNGMPPSSSQDVFITPSPSTETQAIPGHDLACVATSVHVKPPVDFTKSTQGRPEDGLASAHGVLSQTVNLERG